MFEVTKEFKFEAAHSLPHLPEGHKCKRLHGHSYRFVVRCVGELDNRGFVIDYAEITQIVNPIVMMLDHHNIDEIIKPSTAEMLAKWLYKIIKPALPQLNQVEVYETAATCVVYPVKAGVV